MKPTSSVRPSLSVSMVKTRNSQKLVPSTVSSRGCQNSPSSLSQVARDDGAPWATRWSEVPLAALGDGAGTGRPSLLGDIETSRRAHIATVSKQWSRRVPTRTVSRAVSMLTSKGSDEASIRLRRVLQSTSPATAPGPHPRTRTARAARIVVRADHPACSPTPNGSVPGKADGDNLQLDVAGRPLPGDDVADAGTQQSPRQG